MYLEFFFFLQMQIIAEDATDVGAGVVELITIEYPLTYGNFKLTEYLLTF